MTRWQRTVQTATAVTDFLSILIAGAILGVGAVSYYLYTHSNCFVDMCVYGFRRVF